MLFRNDAVFASIEADQRLVLQVRDDRKAIIKLAEGNGAGPELHFGPEDEVKLVFERGPDSTFETWNCTCGTWKCDRLHRISGWDIQSLPPSATFLSMLHTAIDGPLPKLQVKSFVEGMYYALLCDGE
jgi:hypothetical protein